MYRSLFSSLLILSVLLTPATSLSQESSTEDIQRVLLEIERKKSEERRLQNDRTDDLEWQKPKFGLVVRMARVGNQATSVGTRFGIHLDNLPGNRANANFFDLDAAYGVYGLSKASLNRFRNDYRQFVFGSRSYPSLGMNSTAPMPSYTEVANDPRTTIQQLGFGTEFKVGKKGGNVYHVAPSIDLFGEIRTFRLNISNSFFKRR